MALTSVADNLGFLIKVYAVVLSVIGIVVSTRRFRRLWKTKHLRKVWGIRDGDFVIIVCSELDEPEKRQNVEPREFIYSLKYGDVDAFFETVVTLLRLFPNIKLRIMSSGEAETTRFDLTAHLVLIGGPDYNAITASVLKKQVTQYQYRSPYVEKRSEKHPSETVLYNSRSGKEFCEFTDEKDYGYFERITNPNNSDKTIILIGGCHTIGVTGAIKAFSMAESEHGEISRVVLVNAKRVTRMISAKSDFAVLFPVERVGQTINVPIVKEDRVSVRQSGH